MAGESEALGALLKRYRRQAGLTQEELAERAGVSARSVSGTERGVQQRPHVSTLRRLADALALPPERRVGFLTAGKGSRAEVQSWEGVPSDVSPVPGSEGASWEGRPESPVVLTFLIADVRGYARFTQEHGDEAAARLAGRFAELCKEVVGTHEARIVELRGDEAMAVFPSARQALRAAVELQVRFAQEADSAVPLYVGIGLDAGEPVPLEGGYRGGALNLAARLCALAGPGEVLASEGVVHLARKVEGLRYVERGAAQLKGFEHPVRVVEVHPSPTTPVLSGSRDPVRLAEEGRPTERGARGDRPIGGFLGALPTGALVAREEELRTVLTMVDAVAGGSGRLVLLAGEPGVGKTRLAQEVTMEVASRGFVVSTGSCYEPQQVVPFYPFLEALAALYEAAPSIVRDEVGRRWQYLTRLLPEHFGTQALVHVDSQEGRERLFWAVAGFVQVLAESAPAAVLLDDLHWADEASLALFHHLGRQTRGCRVLLLGTYRHLDVGRQHPLEGTLRDLLRDQLMEQLPIRRLGQDGTAALTAAVLGEAEVSEELTELLHRWTEGNPFFVQQLLRALVERGDVCRRDGRWTRTAAEELPVPEGVRSVIRQRLCRLHETTQELLHEASVLGQSFLFDDLRLMSNRDEIELEQALEEATLAGLVREWGKDGYAFDHALTQQALYGESSARRKLRLHLAAGQALEQLPQGPRERRAAELAWHFLEGNEVKRALTYVMLAGDQAEAERHYRTALRLVQELSSVQAGQQTTEAEALEKLGRELRIEARYDEALEVLEQAAHRYGHADRDAEARTIAEIVLTHRLRGTKDEGIARGESLLETAADTKFGHGLCSLCVALANLYGDRGRHVDALAAAIRATELARAIGDNHGLVSAEVVRGWVLVELRQWEDGLRVLQDVIPLLEARGDLDNLSTAYHICAMVHLIRGQFDKVRRYYEGAVQLAERTGIQRALSGASLTLASFSPGWVTGTRHVAMWSGLWRYFALSARRGCLRVLSFTGGTSTSWKETGRTQRGVWRKPSASLSAMVTRIILPMRNHVSHVWTWTRDDRRLRSLASRRF